jgi:hypothetical protein
MSKNRYGLMIYVVHPRVVSTSAEKKWDVYEEVYVRNGIRKNLLEQSTIVLDCANMEVYKNRSDHKDDFYTIISYLAKSHQQVAEFKEVYDTFMNQMEKVEQEMREAAEEGTTESPDTTETPNGESQP